MKRTRRYPLLMAGPILIVLINAWVASHALRRLFQAQDWLQHTLKVLTTAQDVQIGMSSANSAARGFLLTGTPVFTARYRDSERVVYAGIDQLRELTNDNPEQQQRIATLRKRVTIRLGALDAVMGMRRSRHGEPMSSTVLAPALDDSPDGGISVKYAITQIENEEQRLLNYRYENARAGRRDVVISFTAATILDLILLVVAFQQLVNARKDREELAGRASKINSLNIELGTLNSELEERVEQRTRELEISNQELQAFSYSVSHDLRAPLRTIDGFSLALAEDFSEVLNEEGRDYISRVRGGVQRMGTLIDALLQLSRVTRSDVQREAVDLSQLATLVFNELRVNETDRAIQLAVEPGIVAEADPRLMRVAFENLVGNALKFSSKTPEARVEFGHMQRDGNTVYFIRDNGAGFDMQYVDRLFTAFQRLHGDREFKGSGIGLATVSRIIRRHHGTIWAEGKIGEGAAFYFTLQP